jgi:hypothetical protein
VAPRAPSYFSLEKTDLPETGRVLRFDSFSKVLSAGIRLGSVSGPDAILGCIERYVSSTFRQVFFCTIGASLLRNPIQRRSPHLVDVATFKLRGSSFDNLAFAKHQLPFFYM